MSIVSGAGGPTNQIGAVTVTGTAQSGYGIVATSASAASWQALAAGLTLLSTTTLGSAGTFDVSSISGSYNDLILMLIARSSTAGANVSLVLNADGGGNYYTEKISATATTVAAAEGLGPTSFTAGILTPSTAPASLFGICQIEIPGYASTAWKKSIMWQVFAPFDITTGNLSANSGGGVWNSTAAVNRVQISASGGGTWVTGSHLRIYGRL